MDYDPYLARCHDEFYKDEETECATCGGELPQCECYVEHMLEQKRAHDEYIEEQINELGMDYYNRK